MNIAKIDAPARHYIGGEWVHTDAEVRQSFDPATGEALGGWLPGSAELADQAIAVAREAFDRND